MKHPGYSILDHYQFMLMGMGDMRFWQKTLGDYLVVRGHIA